ncbi:cell division cycle-associated protein 4-like isoform X2 [Antedon mediterranea]|uniref:cell division cycle-associated protein 4-like isoform X2 n=1 Tax=Antedon mediterranea TaxID=105859 RepID=UPI003AF4239D
MGRLIVLRSSMPVLVNPRLKRKFIEVDEIEGRGGIHYCVQRQSVLNISICKLQMSRALIEPCLRRSVLICNTLRQIEKELRSEGKFHDCKRLTNLIAANQTGKEEEDEANPEPRIGEDGLCHIVKKDAIGALNLCKRTENVCASDILDNRTLPTLKSNNTHVGANQPNTIHKPQRIFTDSPSLKAHDFSCDILMNPADQLSPDDFFRDIDITQYDYDITASVIPNSKSVTPMCTADDLLKSVCLDLSPYSLESPTTQGLCRTDLTDELDQIMHVLVDVGM